MCWHCLRLKDGVKGWGLFLSLVCPCECGLRCFGRRLFDQGCSWDPVQWLKLGEEITAHWETSRSGKTGKTLHWVPLAVDRLVVL